MKSCSFQFYPSVQLLSQETSSEQSLAGYLGQTQDLYLTCVHSIWITASPVPADKWPEAGYMILEKSRKHQAIPLMQALPGWYSRPLALLSWAHSLFPGTEDVQMAFLHNFMHESAPSVTDSMAARRRPK